MRTNDVDANTIEDAGSLMFAVGIDVFSDGGGKPDNNNVTNNSISGFAHVAPTATIAEAIRVLAGENNTVVGNEISNTGNLQYGIDIRTTESVSVTSNKVEGMMGAGLYLWGGASSRPLEVKKNQLTNNVTGIWVAAGASEITDCNLIQGGATGIYIASMADAASTLVNGNCIGCCILCRNDGASSLDATGNYWVQLPQPGINIFGSIDYSDALDECPCSDWIPGDDHPGTVCCTYLAGWNFMSPSVVPTNPSVPPVLAQYPLLHYEPATGYSQPTYISCTEGYWLYVPPTDAPLEVCVQGTSPSTDQTIDLTDQGWHQIGTGIEGAYWENTEVTYNGIAKSVDDAASAGWIYPAAFEYDPEAGNYDIPTILHVCKGYWVYTYNDNVTLRPH